MIWFENVTPKELLDNVEKTMDGDIKESLAYASIELKKIMTKKVEEWYASRTPTDYVNRTYQVLQAITIGQFKKTTNGYEVEVYFDYGKLELDLDNDNNGWLSHKTTQGQKENFWKMMEDGWHLPDGTGEDFKGHGAIAEAIDWGEVGKFGKEIEKWLKREGYILIRGSQLNQ